MPITTAHPLFVYPLRKLKSFHYSALIIGSIIPDIIHFIPGPIERHHTHDIVNTLLLDVPMALMLYLLFHLILKRPLWDILPDWFQKRIPQSHMEGKFPQPSRWIPILISLFVGIWSHILWDSFTHYYDFGAVYILPFLSRELFTISKYTVYPTTFLQHGSSILGSLFMFWIIIKWFINQRSINAASRKEYSTLLLSIGITLSGIYALPKAFVNYPIQGSYFVKGCQSIRVMVFGGGETVVMGLLFYALLWNCFKMFRHDSAGWHLTK